MIWYMCILWNNYHSKLSLHPTPHIVTIFLFVMKTFIESLHYQRDCREGMGWMTKYLEFTILLPLILYWGSPLIKTNFKRKAKEQTDIVQTGRSYREEMLRMDWKCKCKLSNTIFIWHLVVYNLKRAIFAFHQWNILISLLYFWLYFHYNPIQPLSVIALK